MPGKRPGRIKANSVRHRYSTTTIYQKLVEDFDLDGFISRTANLLLNNLPPIDAVAVFLYDDFAKQQIPVSVSCRSRGVINHIPLEEKLSLVDTVFKTGKPVMATTKQKPARAVVEAFCPNTREEPFRLLCIPMILKNNTCIGSILFLRKYPKTFSTQELIFFSKVTKLLGVFSYKVRILRQNQEKHVTNLVSLLSHELRTPLTCIKGYVTTLFSEHGAWDSEKRYEYLKIVDSEADRMNKLIDELLESTMIESGLLSITKEPILLKKIVKKTVTDANLKTTRHRFILNISSDLPIIEADPVRIRQVIENLLDNAIRYSPEGGLIVISCYSEKKEVKITVADEGIGIAPEHLNRLFEKYYRIKSDIAGTGLGLPIACEIVEKHGGRIWARSTPDKGSTFFFTLPLTGDSEPYMH